jgi:hypothetical protein
MTKAGIDQDALIDMFAQASARQGEQLRKAVNSATLQALKGRELSLDNMRKVIKSVTQATSMGAQKNPGSAVDVEVMLGKAIAGMDAALLQAVQAQRTALQQMVERGVGMRDTQMKAAMQGIEQMEDMFFDSIGKAVQGVPAPLQAPWQQAMKAMKLEGTATGAQAAQTVEHLMAQAKTTLRETRASSLRATQVLMDSYAAMVSGVLIGMSEAFGSVQGDATPAAKKRSSAK